MGILSGNPEQEPMHYGEVFGIWSHVMIAKGLVAGYQTFINHAGDKDLKKLLQEAIEICQGEIKEMEELLKKHEVGPPPTPPERPKAQLEDIPAGARAMDPEIAAKLSADVAAGLVACSTMIGQSIREDIAMIFGKLHTVKAAFGAKVLRLNKEKGWLVPPPLHQPSAKS